MPTLAPRINVTVPKDVATLLKKKAKRDKTSLSKTVLDLVMAAMESDEDIYLAKLAEKRESESTRYYSHEEAWK